MFFFKLIFIVFFGKQNTLINSCSTSGDAAATDVRPNHDGRGPARRQHVYGRRRAGSTPVTNVLAARSAQPQPTTTASTAADQKSGVSTGN